MRNTLILTGKKTESSDQAMENILMVLLTLKQGKVHGTMDIHLITLTIKNIYYIVAYKKPIPMIHPRSSGARISKIPCGCRIK